MRRSLPRLVEAALGAAILLLAGAAGAARAAGFEEILAKPMSPGSIGLLARYRGGEGLAERLALALEDRRAATRAVAARTIDVTRLEALAPRLRAALEKEPDPGAGLEMVRALFDLSPPDQDPGILDLAARLGHAVDGEVATSLARARGNAAIPVYFSRLRDESLTPGEREEFFLVATRHGEQGIDTAAATALQASDADTWTALLQVSVTAGAPIDGRTIALALAHPDPRLSGTTAWHLVSKLPQRPKSELPGFLEALGPPDDEARLAAGDPDLALGREMLGRLLGRAPHASRRWVDLIGSDRNSHLDSFASVRRVMAALVEDEHKAMKKRWKRRYPDRKLPDCLVSSDWKDPMGQKEVEAPRRRLEMGQPMVRTVAGFPAGLVSSLMDSSGCVVSESSRIVEARVTYDEIGRPVKVAMTPDQIAAGCRDAASALFALSVAPADYVPQPGVEETLLVFMDRDFLAHLDTSRPELSHAWLTDEDGGVEPPKRVRFVAPAYPESMRLNRVESRTVLQIEVGRDGFVRDLRVMKTKYAPFTVQALWAVMQWVYEPATWRGKPVSTQLTVIIDYNLR